MNDIDRLDSNVTNAIERLDWQSKMISHLLARLGALETRADPEARVEPKQEVPLNAPVEPTAPAWTEKQVAEAWVEFAQCMRCALSGDAFLSHLRGECKDV